MDERRREMLGRRGGSSLFEGSFEASSLPSRKGPTWDVMTTSVLSVREAWAIVSREVSTPSSQVYEGHTVYKQ